MSIVCANHDMTDIIRSAYANTLEMEEGGREEVVLYTDDFRPDA